MVGSFDEGTTRRPTVNYAMAMAATAAAFIVRALFDSTLGDDLPFLAFYFAVIVSAGRWGIGPGLTALALGIGPGAYFFCEPRF